MQPRWKSSIYGEKEIERYLLQDLEDHKEGPRSLQENAIVANMIALINTTLNKSSGYTGFVELFEKRFLKGYGRVDTIADCYITKPAKSSTIVTRSHRRDFHNSILRNSYHKKGVIELLFEYIEREAKHCTELSGNSRIILSSKNNAF